MNLLDEHNVITMAILPRESLEEDVLEETETPVQENILKEEEKEEVLKPAGDESDNVF